MTRLVFQFKDIFYVNIVFHDLYTKEAIQHNVINFVRDLLQVNGFL